jgi:CheY-like chemotaxis protein
LLGVRGRTLIVNSHLTACAYSYSFSTSFIIFICLNSLKMLPNQKLTDPEHIIFNEADFNLLMQKRIRRVLLICSTYDAYVLEEDGRIEDQIFKEYVSLNLRQPPSFRHTDSARKAFEILESEPIDLVIEMLSIPDIDPFGLAHRIKEKYQHIPIVVLTHFSREVSLKLKNEDLSAVDYVFCWLGNADLLLAIIKLLEDRMNAENDVANVGVQTILLLEDSIRFTSIYLPSLYKVVFNQSREFLKEALNEHQRRLRMRGRPKILLATTYNEATAIYQKYKHNLLGVISDISMKEDAQNSEKIKGGMRLCEMVRKEDPYMPFVFQSSDLENEKLIGDLNVGFIHKYSKTLSSDLENYIANNFGFGDFIFRNPSNMEEIARASDLVQLQQQILKVPDESFVFHTSRNEISKWLNARSLFPIANMFKQIQVDDFASLSDARKYIVQAMASYRLSRATGIIVNFDRNCYDEQLPITRIGEGSVGGKARGLVFLSSIIKRYRLNETFPNVHITIPLSVVVSTEIFEKFMESNNLYEIAMSDAPDEVILKRFLEASLPQSLSNDLLAFVLHVQNPIAVRSSSKLEDSQYQPFAGIYSTYMVPNPSNEPAKTLQFVLRAIKAVYASVYFKSSKAYMAATSNVIDEEQMGIIIQELCGKRYNQRFYPTLSGTARSINFYPIPPEKSNDGIVNIGFGLGKYVVDGGVAMRFSPKYPKNLLQLSSVSMAIKDTQKQFYALDLASEGFEPNVDDSSNLLKLKISDAEVDKTLRFVASTFDLENNMIRDGVLTDGKRIITFANILQHNTFPLAEILDTMLEIGHQEMGSPVEIEFAVNLDVSNGKHPVFNFLQIRPIVFNDQRITFKIDDVSREETIIQSSAALGNGYIENIYDMVYVKPEAFKSSETKNIVTRVETLNTQFIAEKRNYILVGPGRWGSSDPWLGIPVKWPQISEARVIVESGLENYRIDPSQGTHFFQNLTTFRVGYLTVNPYNNDGFYDVEYLNHQPALYEDEFLRRISFNQPIKVVIDSRNNKAVVFKPKTPMDNK